jgi:hypothetical protein
VKDHPKGYPQLAAFLNSDDDFAIVRRFGKASCRTILHLQSELCNLEEKLSELDRSDARPGSPTLYRLQSIRHQDNWDPAQRQLTLELQEKLTTYCKQPLTLKGFQGLILYIDDFVLKDTQMRALGKPLKCDQRSVLNWITTKRPVMKGEDDWILNRHDLVALAKIDPVESILASSALNVHSLHSTPAITLTELAFLRPIQPQHADRRSK